MLFTMAKVAGGGASETNGEPLDLAGIWGWTTDVLEKLLLSLLWFWTIYRFELFIMVLSLFWVKL